jgi:GT2 family glycosyltransferase
MSQLYEKLGHDLERIQCHNSESPIGYFANLNKALEHYEGEPHDFYVFTNDDITIHPGFLDDILKCPTERPILYAPLIKDKNGDVQMSVYRKDYTKLGMFWRINDEGLYTRISSRLGFKVRRPSDINKGRYTVYGCCFIMNALSLKDIGELDGDIFLYYEEAYFSVMVKKFGWDCKVLEDTEINHVAGATMTKGYYINRSRIDMQAALCVAERYMGFNGLQLLALRIFKWIELVVRQITQSIRNIF